MLLVAPLLPNPSNTTITFGWDVFSAWDSEFYRKIATSGYDFSMKKREFSVAFFPLFPLLIRAVMSIGFSFEMAGTLVNNLAFLAALIILYFWIEERYSTNAARWSTAVLIWCPYSIYGTIIYTEGLFLLCSIAALRAFDKQQYILAAFWGALSTATRSPGLALIPAFLFMSWKERRGIKAYSASFAVSLGILLYSLYCQIQFGDALAFVHAQKGWRESAGFAWQGWLKMLMQIVVGKANWQNGKIVDIWHPLLFLLIICGGYLLWQFHQRLGLDKVHYGLYTLWLLLWLLVGDELIKSVVIFGGFGLLLLSKNQIPLVTFIYGICAYSLIFNTGITASAERYVYGIVSMAIAFGLLLTRYPRLGYAIISFFAILLLLFSIRFAQNQWVA
ncbi:MAG: glycosyltransferase family 39 protein [Desmonostoc vinosum HA7617-LM4]|nr:glycosyltransferase family 39 protein [Desmonostoc vinosum HA7617-LM4]